MSKGAKIGIVLGVLAIVLLIGAWAGGLFGGPSDEEQIQTALDEAILASKEGRPGGVLDLLSQQFTIVGAERPGTAQIAKAIRELKPSVEMANRQPNINGDQANIVTPVELSILTQSITVPEVTLRFEREDSRKWLIFPAKSWKLVEVTVPREVIDSFQWQFGTGL